MRVAVPTLLTVAAALCLWGWMNPAHLIGAAPAEGSGLVRVSGEVTHVAGRRIAPTGIPVLNAAFDVTPARLVTAIITERGVARAPYRKSLSRLVDPLAVKRQRRERGGG